MHGVPGRHENVKLVSNPSVSVLLAPVDIVQCLQICIAAWQHAVIHARHTRSRVQLTL